MKTLKRWLSQNARRRYWKMRAFRSEQKLADVLAANAREVRDLRDLLEAERWRNLSREDTFVSATVMGGRNMFGVPPRTGPAIKQAGYGSTAVKSLDPWDSISYADKAEFDQFWKKDAEDAGVPIQQARAQFLIELANRRAIQDEPTN